MVTQYACDKPASWPFNVIKPSVAKKDLLSQSLEWYMHCVVLVTFARAENINKISVQANLRIPKIMVLWQAVFLPASPLVTARRQISLDFITTAHSTATQYHQLRRPQFRVSRDLLWDN